MPLKRGLNEVYAQVDGGFSVWDPARNYHPWLRDEPPIPFRYGDYRALRRRYLPPDYLRDAAGYEVRGTVYVETEWDPGRFVDVVEAIHRKPNDPLYPAAVELQRAEWRVLLAR